MKTLIKRIFKKKSPVKVTGYKIFIKNVNIPRSKCIDEVSKELASKLIESGAVTVSTRETDGRILYELSVNVIMPK